MVAPGGPSRIFQPAYLALWQSGELARRVERALGELADCTLCPRDCHIDRLADKFSVCRVGRDAPVTSYFPHFGEEDCLRGWHGSGTIFFAAVICAASSARTLRRAGGGRRGRVRCHNINFVTPEHVVPQILEALLIAVEAGLRLPLVYNTSAYDSLDSLELLDGLIDIYMPDFKFWDPDMARRYVRAPDYPETARRAIHEMHRQVGPLVVEANGLALRGLILRQLVMPGSIAGTRDIPQWAARELGPDTYVNIMSQYFPAGKVSTGEHTEINRTITSTNFSRRSMPRVMLGCDVWITEHRSGR